MADFFNAIRKDAEFFTKHNIMDYSLLIIVIKKPQKIKKTVENYNLNCSFSTDDEEFDYETLLEQIKIKRFVFASPSGNFIYLFGIIDYLQLYNQ